jgi:hypothetical protein
MNDAKATIDTYNRFKDLQKEWGQKYFYTEQAKDINIKCSVAYLPFEGRIDRVTFEVFLHKTQPKNLIMVNLDSSINHVR